MNKFNQTGFTRKVNFKKLNPQIDFERESKKTNARKTDTEVICCTCKKKVTLPFKPRNPEVYCDECFKKRNKKSKY